jgi:hypothetical protein
MTTASLPEYGTPTYGITKKLPGKDFDQVVDNVTAELKKNGSVACADLTVLVMLADCNNSHTRHFVIPYYIDFLLVSVFLPKLT